jgi:hypothetical protein
MNYTKEASRTHLSSFMGVAVSATQSAPSLIEFEEFYFLLSQLKSLLIMPEISLV